jgi:hypothetical protein
LETQEENVRNESNEDEEVAETTEEEDAKVEESGTQVVTISGRQVTRPSRYVMLTKVWQ